MIARGAPRFSITSERRSTSTRSRSLPKLVRARKADTTILSFLWVFAIGTNSSVGVYELYSSFATDLITTWDEMHPQGPTLWKLVDVRGLEPLTPCLQSRWNLS